MMKEVDKMLLKRILFVIICLQSCMRVDNKNDMNPMNNDLLYILSEIDYGKLFLTSNYVLRDSIWDDGNNENALISILKNEDNSMSVRFIAAEILRSAGINIVKDFPKQVSSFYAYALMSTAVSKKNILRLNGNLWGLLYEEDDVGHLGKIFIELNELALKDLKELLHDKSLIRYEGSQEATLGNDYQYRVKDFAAFYISKIKDIPMTFYQDFEKRDAEIKRLQEILDNE